VIISSLACFAKYIVTYEAGSDYVRLTIAQAQNCSGPSCFFDRRIVRLDVGEWLYFAILHVYTHYACL